MQASNHLSLNIRYNTLLKSQDFPLSLKVKEIISIAKNLFDLPNEIFLKLLINKTACDDEFTLADLGLKGIAELEVASPNEKDAIFRMFGDTTNCELSVDWLQPVKELKSLVAELLELPTDEPQRWCVNDRELEDEASLERQLNSEDIIIEIEKLASFKFSFKRGSMSILLNPDRQINFLQREVGQKINMKPENQVWYLNDSKVLLKADRSLSSYTIDNPSCTIYVENSPDNSQSLPSVRAKKVYTFNYKNTTLKKQYFTDENLENVLVKISESFKIPKEEKICLKFKEEIMDPKKSLLDYMQHPEGVIVVAHQEDDSDTIPITIMIMINDDFKDISAKRKDSIQVLKDRACAAFEISDPSLYTLFLDLQELKDYQLLSETGFGDDSVFELHLMIEINLIVKTEFKVTKKTFCFGAQNKVCELKSFISTEKIVDFAKFDLFSEGKLLKEEQSLSHYIQQDRKITITIQDNTQTHPKLKFAFCKIPENKEFFITIPGNVKFDELKEILSKEAQVDPDLQVWTYNGEKILTQDSFARLVKANSGEPITIDFFESSLPYIQDVTLVTIQANSSKPHTIRLDLTDTIAHLKQTVAITLAFPSTLSQIWKFRSQELKDDLPLVVQYAITEKEPINVETTNTKELVFSILGQERRVSVNLDTPVSKLKALHNEIRPENQLWSLDQSMSQELDDEQALSTYLKDDDDSSTIWVSERAYQIQLKLCDIDSNEETLHHLNGNPQSNISELKKLAYAELQIDPKFQFWMLDGIELSNNSPLTQYIVGKIGAIEICVFVLKPFSIQLLNNEKIKMSLPLNMKLKALKEKLSETDKQIKTEDTIISAYQTPLNDEKSLSDYLELWKDQPIPLLVVKQLECLIVKFAAKQEKFFFYHFSTSLDLIQSIKEAFKFQDHDVELREGEKIISDEELESIRKNQIEKTLICNKIKTITMVYNDLKTTEESVKADSLATALIYLKQKASEKLKVSAEFCIINLNDVPKFEETQTFEDINPNSSTLKCVVDTVKEIEITHNGLKYITKYVPSESFSKVKARLKTEGFEDIDNFLLIFNQKIMHDDQNLQASGILYGKHFGATVKKRSVTVFISDEAKTYTCGGDLSSIADLKNLIEDNEGIKANKQVLILLKGNEWCQKLADLNQKLDDLAPEGEDIFIQLRKSIKFNVIYCQEANPKVFEGMIGTSIKEHKKLFELLYKVPVSHQTWIIGPINKPQILNDDETIETYNVQSDEQNGTIRIFRKINLTVCLSEKTETLLGLPTYETIRAQKMKVAKQLGILHQDQLWSYNDVELEDDKILENYFEPSNEKEVSSDISSYAVDLIVTTDLEYFGFTDRNEINVDLFTSFFIESDEELDKIIESVSFNKKESSLQFRNKLLGLFFGTLKKHSLWENLITKIQQKTFEKKDVNLWKNNEREKTAKSKFNSQFLLYYFLNSGTSDLNIEILKIMKMHFPLPLAIKTWSNRFACEDSKVLNDLYWVLQKSFVISSFGFGGAETKVCGKTELNNSVLFTNFVKDIERNPVCKGSPEMSFDIYKNDKFPVNVVDIPSGTSEEVQKRIIANSNMLIIHSLADKEKTLEFINSLPSTIPKIIFYRDVPDAFCHISSFKSNLSNSLKTGFTTNMFEIKVGELDNEERPNEISEISARVHEFILKTIEKINESELWKFFNFFEGHNPQIHPILERIKQNSSNLISAIPTFAQIKQLERDESLDFQKKQNEIAKIKQDFKEKLLTSEINGLLELLITSDLRLGTNYSDTSKLLLEKLQNYLRMMKNQQTIDYYRLYEFKASLSENSSHNEVDTINKFFGYWEKLKSKNVYYKDQTIETNSNKEQVLKFITWCVEVFEQKIIPNIFSIELFWRELVYFTNLSDRHEFKLGLNTSSSEIVPKEQIPLLDFLVKMKRENILNGDPFEIIDGDLLYMPKDFFKSVFKGLNDRVIIISVLGPQSSGKSTLLNFLFGCNFVTSSGRCTKGIYGTYFKVSNFNSCDGILVLDTEGLFGLLNKSEEQQRDKFDRKLILFCLAMSDFVLINFKGDIDKTLTEVLMICKDSLKKLQQGNIHIPEMFLILNQNTQTNINTQLQDINKMGDRGFSQANVEVLPLAFETHVEKNKTIEQFMDPIMSKKPKKEFSEKCCALALKVFDKIKSNLDGTKQLTLEGAIERMEHLWELLNNFPDLLRHTNVKDFNREIEIKSWIDLEVGKELKSKLIPFVEKFKSNSVIDTNWENSFQDLFITEEKTIKKAFSDAFQEHTSPDLFSDMEKTLFTHLTRVKAEALNELNLIAHQKKIKIYDIHGIETIRDIARKVKSQPHISEQEKNEYFEEKWQELIKKIEESYNRNKESQRLFQTVKENYVAALINITGGLPATSFPQHIELSFADYKNRLLSLVKDYYLKDKAFEYTKEPPALVFKGGKSNVTLKYLDLNKCFEYVEIEEPIGILKSKLYQLFNAGLIRSDITKNSNVQSQEVFISDELLRRIDEELKAMGIIVPFHFLGEILEFKKKWFYGKWFADDPTDLKSFFPDCYVNYSHELPKNLSDFKWILPTLILEKRAELRKQHTTRRQFFNQVLSSYIKWEEAKKVIDKEASKMYQQLKTIEISRKLEEDLSKLNLKFQHDSFNPAVFVSNDISSDQYISKINNEITSSHYPIQNNNFQQDLEKQRFHYINKQALKTNMQRLSTANQSQYLILAKWRGKKLVVKSQFSHISWLASYAREDSTEIFQNTVQNRPLLDFVFNILKFDSLLANIYDGCTARINQTDNWNYTNLYQDVARLTNDMIGEINNDLQQVSYRLDFKIVGHIHLSLTYLIWKFFEEKHWLKITEPLAIIKDKKDQQKKYYEAMTSSDHKKINEAEAEKAKQFVENYTKTEIVSNIKRDVIKSTAESFKRQISRKQIQEQIDSKYFSRNAAADNDDLYYYMLNSHEVLIKEYEETIKNYKQNLSNELQQKRIDLNSLLQSLLQRIMSILNLLTLVDEELWSIENIYEFTKCDGVFQNEVLLNKYENELGLIYYKVVVSLLQGDSQKAFSEHEVNPDTKVSLKKIEALKSLQSPSVELNEILEALSQRSGKVTNAVLFIKALSDQINQLILSLNNLFELEDTDSKEFEDKINIFVCKQTCPCCDRICGVEDPTHQEHQCLYGHQIRGIGGAMLENNEASVARCEDIADIDKIQFNGQDMTWMEFKDKMSKQANNPWTFDDIHATRDDEAIKEKFNFAWTLIGARICNERHKDIGMKYVPFNQAVIDSQKVGKIAPKNYIYMIDSSSSMSSNGSSRLSRFFGGINRTSEIPESSISKWKELQTSLKKTLGDIHNLNKDSRVTIINFSNDAKVEYVDEPPNSVNVEALTLQNGGTNFEAAFAEGLEEIKKVKANDILLIFMTDGESRYPDYSISQIQGYLESPSFKNLNIKFNFNAIGFQCRSGILEKLAKALGGTTYFADDGSQLTKTFKEIISKKEGYNFE